MLNRHNMHTETPGYATNDVIESTKRSLEHGHWDKENAMLTV